METVKNWKNEDIEVIRSRGGVIATINFKDNLIIPERLKFLPIELIQKSYKSRHGKAFQEEIEDYCDLQSINSEDAMVWSYFSSLEYGTYEEKYPFTKELFGRLDITIGENESIDYFLWRKIPNPETKVFVGPEIDFGIITDSAFILGEAKWKSGIDEKQGKLKNKTQLESREEFFEIFKDSLLDGFEKRVQMKRVQIRPLIFLAGRN